MSQWDYNELGTLLIACLEIEGEQADSESLFHAIADGETPYEAFSDAMDWEEYGKDKQEKRAEKLAEWIDSDIESASIWKANNAEKFESLVNLDSFNCYADLSELMDGDSVGSFYRCKETPDMFETLNA